MTHWPDSNCIFDDLFELFLSSKSLTHLYICANIIITEGLSISYHHIYKPYNTLTYNSVYNMFIVQVSITNTYTFNIVVVFTYYIGFGFSKEKKTK